MPIAFGVLLNEEQNIIFDLSYDSIVKIIEEVEKLEQLRWLKNGLQIGCLSVYYNGVEINAPGDVIEWQQKNLQ